MSKSKNKALPELSDNLDPEYDFNSEEEFELESDLESEIESLRDEINDLKNKTSSCAPSLIYILGVAIAVVVSYTNNASILLATFQGLLSWVYVIYKAIVG